MPTPTVQVLLDDGTDTWQHDVTAYVRLVDGIAINRGRQDEFAEVQPSTCTLTLDNSDGFFTPAAVAKPNLLGNGSFEVNTAGWFITSGVTQLTQTSTQANVGSKSMAIYCTGGADAQFMSHRFAVTSASHAVMSKIRAATTGRSCSIWFSFWDAAGNALSNSSAGLAFNATGAWSTLQKTPVTPPSGAVEGAINVRISGPAAGEVHYFDAAYAAGYAFTGADVYTEPTLPTEIDSGIRVKVTANAVTTDRFTGYVQSWPASWPSGDETFATRTITAVDRLARLSRRKLRSPLENAVLLAKPSGYYLLSEAAGALSAGDSSGRGGRSVTVVQRGVGGTLEFGNGTGPAKDGHTAATFTRASASDGLYLAGTASGEVINSSSWWVRCAVSTSTSAQQTFVYLVGKNGLSCYLGCDTSGFLRATGNSFVVVDTASIATGSVRDVVVVADAAATTAYLYLDGVLVDTSPYTPTYVLNLASFTIGGATGSDLADATLSHVAFGAGTVSAGTVADWYAAGSDGFVADSSDERIARYASYANIATADQVLEAGDLTAVAHIDTNSQSVASAMQKVATSEQGILFINGSGQLAFHARSHRYVPTVAATLTAADIDPGSALSRDTQGLINTVTASREGGATQLYEVPSSIRAHEQYPSSLDLAVTTDDEALIAASWVANTHAEPTVRLPGVPVDLMSQSAAFAASVQALELGSAVAVTGLPSQAEATDLTLFVEGWSEQISLTDWTQTFNTSPLVTVWTLEDPVSGFIDRTFVLAY